MNRRNFIFPIIVILMVTMACTSSYEGVAIGSDPDIEMIEDQTATAENAQRMLPVPEQALSTPDPAYQPAVPQASKSEAETESTGPAEYSVTATNFDCTCQVDGNVTVEFNFKGDKLEFTNAGGGVDVYDKIGENTYKRSWMGYYILSSGPGADATETRVDEERSVVIILNDNGYVMEHYQGSNSSPCCFHTFTNTK
jgi:hypothetical protein